MTAASNRWPRDDVQPVSPTTAEMATEGKPQEAKGASSLPSELIMAARWDTLLERVVLNAGAGAVLGLAASFVLTRGMTMRVGLSLFGAGTGVGAAVERSSAEMAAADKGK